MLGNPAPRWSKTTKGPKNMNTDELIEKCVKDIYALAVEYQADITQQEFKKRLKAVLSDGILAVIRSECER
jgi:hypothetical protein